MTAYEICQQGGGNEEVFSADELVTAVEQAREEGWNDVLTFYQCTCSGGYTSRGLVDPSCVRCDIAGAVDTLRRSIASTENPAPGDCNLTGAESSAGAG